MNKTNLLDNPFLKPFNTPHNTLPFDKINTEHYEPAILEGIRRENIEIEAIANNPTPPTFENTIAALDHTGDLLEKATSAFFNLLSAETNDEMDNLAQKISPILSKHSSDIHFNKRLFDRIKAIHDNLSGFNDEENMLVKEVYIGFERSGATLSEDKKKEMRKLLEMSSKLSLQFSQNNLKDTNDYSLLIKDKKKIEGLPETALEQAALSAKEQQKEGYLFTLQAPSYLPFMTYVKNRDLRKELYMAYHTKCTHSNGNNNLQLVKSIVNTHQQIAQLLGYPSYAAYTLKHRMAETSDKVYDLLHELIENYLEPANKEIAEIAKLAKQEEGENFELQEWDFGYYSNKLKLQKYNIDAELLRPYFELNNVVKGVFGLATRLYGITFKENKSIPVFHPEVKAFEVFNENGTYLAVLYADFHPRKGKHNGAWMTEYKEQWHEDNGTNSRPHVSVTMNFTKSTPTKPALLTLEEVETFLHEFGHALHGMMANTRFASLSGTNVYRDFVELPSQIMENFAIEKDFLHTFAFHYKTGEVISDELVERIKKSRNFNAAYACIRQVNFGILDMAYYTLDKPLEQDIIKFEKNIWSKTALLPQLKDTCMSVQFDHIMAGGYSAGYYSYKWAEVLDADAFQLFKEIGIFNKSTAERFRHEILEKGGTVHPQKLYKNFRGREATINALLLRDDIKK